MSTTPRVTFVVPCYKLAHLLRDCVGSILEQTFGELEVLIMDDASPDDTPSVAQSFGDPRVLHIRNEPNLGHLRNYNKGIGLARGEYVWLISADDKLRKPYVVERFVRALDAHPSAGYAFCPVMKFNDEGETVRYGAYGEVDAIFPSHDFAKRLAHGNGVPAPSGIVRRAMYEKYGAFPLNLPFAGDWYMWCLFALHADVAYFAEPMVSYRLHEQNMTKEFFKKAHALAADQIEVRWRVRALAEAQHEDEIAAEYAAAIADDYAMRCVRKLSEDWAYGMTLEEFEDSLQKHTSQGQLASRIRGWVYSAVGDHHWDNAQPDRARQLYERALAQDPLAGRTAVKWGLARLGRIGLRLRGGAVALREQLTSARR